MSKNLLGWILSAVASTTPTPGPLPTPVAIVKPAPPRLTTAGLAAVKVKAAKLQVDAELAVLDGGPLSEALTAAAKRGLKMRLLLDPSRLGTLQAGVALGKRASVQVAWLPGAGQGLRAVKADEQAPMVWRRGGKKAKAPEGWAPDFEARFTAALANVPELQRLENELKTLPDPSETEPRIGKRREGGGQKESTKEAK